MSPIIKAIRKQLLTKRGLPRGAKARIAEHCGVGRSAVQKWFAGTATPRAEQLETLQSIAKEIVTESGAFSEDFTGRYERRGKKV